MTDHEQRQADGAACLEAALLYLSRGWSVLPLCPWDHVGVGKDHARSCDEQGNRGKRPLINWDAYQIRPPTPEEVAAWWKRWPNANVGIALGSVSGLVGLDADGAEGEQLIERFGGGVLTPCAMFMTPGGGCRFLFQIPAGEMVPSRGVSVGGHKGAELLADGKQTVAPPSRHKLGGYYRWGAIREP